MSLKCIGAFKKEGKIHVTVEGANPEEVCSSQAKTIALEHAGVCGYPHVGFSGTSGAYPVDKEGQVHDDWNELALAGNIGAYRNDIQLQPRL